MVEGDLPILNVICMHANELHKRKHKDPLQQDMDQLEMHDSISMHNFYEFFLIK